MWELTRSEVHIGDLVEGEISNGVDVLVFLAALEIVGREARVLGVHLQGAGSNTLGAGALLSLVRWVKDTLDVDILRVEGAPRTTGAGPGRRPSPIVFR